MMRPIAICAAALVMAVACERSAPEPQQTATSADSLTSHTDSTGEQPATSAPTSAADSAADSDAASASQVISRYYDAINAGHFPEAYAMWSDSGRASKKTLRQFTAGFDSTARTTVRIGEPGRIEGAAGSRFIEIPVDVSAETRNGTAQHFTGTYTLRRAVVDGATAEQRTWHIYDAHLTAR